MQLRTYGTDGPLVVVIHGGPGAPGHMAPVAAGLAGTFRVLEPWQRGSGDEALTVARHVADLHELVTSHRGDDPPALLGSSWGAMLALAYAAAHPDDAGPLVLVGCGIFDAEARSEYERRIEGRMDEDIVRRLHHLDETAEDADARLAAMADLLEPMYSHDLLPADGPRDPCDFVAHVETWSDMVHCQENGVYPAAFSAITTPVLMVHGSVDPHPGTMIRDSLLPHVPHLEYVQWEQCGHYPWRERHASKTFFDVVIEWLNAHSN